VLVERLWPRGMSKERAAVDIWYREVAPTPDLHKWYGHDVAKYPEFRERYLDQLKDNPAVERLRRLATKKTVTLVFATRDIRGSNAALLLDLLTHEGRESI
jgi:uncharacterized protein YeaO (DUF488 family)